MKEVMLPKNVRVGHAQNDCTGCTVIVFDGGAVGGVSVRGGAPGTRETDLLRAESSQPFVNAIVLSGGSAFGLEASCGVMRYLSENKQGMPFGSKYVPLVASAVLFDLNGETIVYPTADMGYSAAKNATNAGVKFGSIGAGKGATVGKIRGMQYACKSGIGAATVSFGDAFVTAIVAVNALGDVVDHNSGELLAGTKANDGSFLNACKTIATGNVARFVTGNTTIGCVITNAKVDKLHANKLAVISHDGMALSVRPTHTDFDGDAMFAAAVGEVDCDFTALCALTTEATATAIENAVREIK